MEGEPWACPRLPPPQPPPPAEPLTRNHSQGLPRVTANGVSAANSETCFLLGLRPRKSQGGDGKLNKSPCDGGYLLAPYWHWPSGEPGEPRTGPEIKLLFQDNTPRLEYHAAAAARCQWGFGDGLGRHLGRTCTPPPGPPYICPPPAHRNGLVSPGDLSFCDGNMKVFA